MRKILVVDDSKAIRDLLSNVLPFMGFHAAVASNGNEGLHLFLSNSFDLVLTDVQMPGMDGWTLALHVKDKSPDTPVVLVTGEEKKGIMEKLKGSCVDSVLFKPFRLEDIQEMIQKMLGNRTLQRGILLPGKDRNSSSKV
jgi:CheY-like chemotaxis protein